MKRLVYLLIILLTVIFIVHAKSVRTVSSATTTTVSQKEISSKLDELHARATDMQVKLSLSHEILKKRGHI